VDSSDLTASSLHASSETARPWQPVTYTAVLRNDSLFAAPLVSATVRLPDLVRPLTDTLASSSGQAALDGQRLRWHGALQPGDTVTVSLVATPTMELSAHWLPATLLVDDHTTAPFIRDTIFYLSPYHFHFPFIAVPPAQVYD
jgi:hypothetical protein